MSKAEEHRNQILVEAFKLFLVKEYANVTTVDFEIIGLSKGLCYDRILPLLAGSLIRKRKQCMEERHLNLKEKNTILRVFLTLMFL